MPTFFDSIRDDLKEWAMAQQVFFTASAPLTGSHVNLSPKGLPDSTFSILSPNTAAYVDATGSGAETISHVYENGRVTIMFCSFGRSPRIMRFFCRGKVIECDQKGYDGLVSRLLEGRKQTTIEGARAVIWLDVFKVQTSCGFGVPYLGLSSSPDPEGQPVPILIDRETLGHYAHKQVAANKMEAYRAKWNAHSLDGCPGLRAAMRMNGEKVWFSLGKATFRRIFVGQWEGVLMGLLLGIVLMAVVRAVRSGLEGRIWV